MIKIYDVYVESLEHKSAYIRELKIKTVRSPVKAEVDNLAKKSKHSILKLTQVWLYGPVNIMLYDATQLLYNLKRRHDQCLKLN